MFCVALDLTTYDLCPEHPERRVCVYTALGGQ